MTAKLVISRKAKRDLLDIFLYTNREVGKAQADSYHYSLESSFKLLADYQNIGKEAEWLGPGLRCYQHHHHSVYYRVENSRIRIVRILHAQRNHPALLKN